MLELLIVSVCISGAGCSEATKAYYSYNHNLQDWAKKEEIRIEKKFGKENLIFTGTVVGLVVIREGTIPVYKNTNLLIGKENMLQWIKEF